jgi:hypothetical protein
MPTPNDPHRHDDYHKQLGLFASVFAQVEAHLFVLLIVLAGVTLPIGRALFSGTRALEAISLMRRVMTAKPPPENIRTTLEAVFAQLALINDIRNHVIHYGTGFAETEYVSSNAIRALSSDKEREFTVSPTILHKISSDLVVANTTLSYCTAALRNKEPESIPPDVMKAQQRAWLYKLPGPAPKGRKTRGATQKP